MEPGASADSWRAAEAQAQDYARKVASGEKFATLARANSKHSSAEHGGANGLVHEGQLGEPADAALRNAKPNEIVGPVRLLEGVALFEVDGKRIAEVMPLSEVKKRAASLLQREGAKRRWSDYVATIRARFSVDQPAFRTFIVTAIKSAIRLPVPSELVS